MNNGLKKFSEAADKLTGQEQGAFGLALLFAFIASFAATCVILWIFLSIYHSWGFFAGALAVWALRGLFKHIAKIVSG